MAGVSANPSLIRPHNPVLPMEYSMPGNEAIPEAKGATGAKREGNRAAESASPTILVFDVNETLIDLESMNPLFENVFGDKRFLREWFAQLILYSQTMTLSNLYEDFWSIGAATFRMLGGVHGIDVRPEHIEALRQGMKTMPAHFDSEEGLQMLKDAGFRMVTLTNSPPTPGARSPLENAGLDRFFERQFNVQSVRAYKPAPAVYQMVARELGVPTSACCLVACHVWDTIGAQATGMAGAFLVRSGNATLPMEGLPQPSVVAADMPSLATALIRMWRT
jgi:2-haloacid dehalogenase